MDMLPDLRALSNEELDHLIDELTKEENEVSFERRRVQGYLDILRAERTARIRAAPSPHLRSSSSPPSSPARACLTCAPTPPDPTHVPPRPSPDRVNFAKNPQQGDTPAASSSKAAPVHRVLEEGRAHALEGAVLQLRHGSDDPEYAVVLTILTLGAAGLFIALAGGIQGALATISGLL